LLSLSTAQTAVKAVASTYINLLVKESDNNVKLIVLDKLAELQRKHTKILQKLAMDILRGLASPNMDIRTKTLTIALELVTPTNISEVVMVFKKEMNRTQSETFENANEYRRVLVKAIHSCAVKFPDVAHDVVYVLLDFIGDDDIDSACEVANFVREVVQTYPQMRHSILEKLISSFDQIQAGSVFRTTLWILGEYTETLDQVKNSLTAIKDLLGPPTFAHNTVDKNDTKIVENNNSGPRVLGDGTYASSSAMSVTETKITSKKNSGHALRQIILDGDSYTASVVATSFSKLYLRLNGMELTNIEKNEMQAQILLYLTFFF